MDPIGSKRPYCNWSIKMARIIGLGSTSVVNSWQSQVGYFFKQKHVLQFASKWKISAKKKSKNIAASMVCISICPQAQQYPFSLQRRNTPKKAQQFDQDIQFLLCTNFISQRRNRPKKRSTCLTVFYSSLFLTIQKRNTPKRRNGWTKT